MAVTITTDPIANKTKVNRRPRIRAVFSAPMNASTITGSTFTMTQAAVGVTATVTYDASTRTAYLHPAKMLGKNLVYVCTLAATIQDGTNTPIGSPTTWQFTTRNTIIQKWFPGLGVDAVEE
jgi:hypothetical protein